MERDYAILAVHLNENVPAYEFSRLASLVNDVYDTFIWLDDVKKSEVRPHLFHSPNQEERLYIQRADIGTPNIIEFIGVSEHLIEAIKFLTENYNVLLSVGSAALVTIEKTNTIFDFMSKVKSYFSKSSKKKEGTTIEVSGHKNLTEELIYLKHTNRLDDETANEKNDFMNYVRDISHVSENIIVSTDMTIIKSE